MKPLSNSENLAFKLSEWWRETDDRSRILMITISLTSIFLLMLLDHVAWMALPLVTGALYEQALMSAKYKVKDLRNKEITAAMVAHRALFVLRPVLEHSDLDSPNLQAAIAHFEAIERNEENIETPSMFSRF